MTAVLCIHQIDTHLDKRFGPGDFLGFNKHTPAGRRTCGIFLMKIPYLRLSANGTCGPWPISAGVHLFHQENLPGPAYVYPDVHRF